MSEELLQTCDAAKQADVTPCAIRRAVREGRLYATARTVRGAYLFHRADVAAYVRSRTKRYGQSSAGSSRESDETVNGGAKGRVSE
jgi:hypothetical protein